MDLYGETCCIPIEAADTLHDAKVKACSHFSLSTEGARKLTLGHYGNTLDKDAPLHELLEHQATLTAVHRGYPERVVKRTSDAFGQHDGIARSTDLLSASISPASSTIVASFKSCRAVILDGDERQEISSLAGWVRIVRITQCGRYVVTAAAGDCGMLRVWNVDGREVARFLAQKHEVNDFCLSPVVVSADGTEGFRVVSASSEEGCVAMWQVFPSTDVHKPAVLLHTEHLRSQPPVLSGFTATSTVLAVSPGFSTLVVSETLSQKVSVFNVGSEMRLSSYLSGHTDEVSCMAFSQDGAVLLSGGLDKLIGVWDMSAEGTLCKGMMSGHNDAVSGLAVSECGEFGFSGCLDGTVGVWCMRECASLCLVKEHSARIVQILALPSERFISLDCAGNMIEWG